MIQERQSHAVAPGEGALYTIGSTGGVVFKVPMEATESQVGIIEHTLTPGALGAPLHLHTHEDEFSYVLEGELTVQVGEEVITARPGTCVVKPRGVYHTFWNAGQEVARWVEVIAPGHFLSYFPKISLLVPVNGPVDMEGALALQRSYGMMYDMERTAELSEKYGVRLG